MKYIKADTLARGYELAVKYIRSVGELVITEDNSPTLESDTICIEVDKPMQEPRLSSKYIIKQNFADKYADALINGCESQFEYDYHSRLIRHDQIGYIINKLKTQGTSRRALAITWIPEIDQNKNDVPCLQLIQCTIRKNKLDMKVVFRSNDMLLALGANMYALTKLQEYIADKLNIEVGVYTHIALIPHIYHVRDACILEQWK